MGTRADFYVNTTWLGSVGWDGYLWAEKPRCRLMRAKTPQEFKDALERLASVRNDFTDPSQGWPWPWTDSRQTDYAYVFDEDEGRVTVYQFGNRILGGSKLFIFPDMSKIQKITFGPRSGVILV